MSAADGRLDELATRWSLDAAQLAKLAELLARLERDPHAPTSVRDPERAVDVHIADSLNGLQLEAVREARTIADLGSGAGFPGLVLAVALPEAHVSLVESASRKAVFIAECAEEAGIANAEVVTARVEEWREGSEAHDLVTARALAPLAVVCEYAAPLLRIGGSLVAWTGRRDPPAEARAAAAAAELGLEPRETVRCAPYRGADDHHLSVYVKLSSTSARFPRRAGMARKNPLGGSTRA
jgi:16S rRNA (guanine527-N7)-methyltransferase